MKKSLVYGLVMIVLGVGLEHCTHFFTNGGATIFYGMIGMFYGLIYGLHPILKALCSEEK